MSTIELAEQRVKDKMINEILKLSDRFRSKRDLESKIFSELKYIYYDCRESNKEEANYSFSRN